MHETLESQEGKKGPDATVDMADRLPESTHQWKGTKEKSRRPHASYVLLYVHIGQR